MARRPGSDNTRYPTRKDLVLLGYKPNPIIGTTALAGKVPRKWSTPLIPIWMDRVMQPELAVVVVFALSRYYLCCDHLRRISLVQGRLPPAPPPLAIRC